MLEIYINNTRVDIFDDTSISLVISNPMLDESGIPTPYSFSFSLPKTTRNLALIEQSHRPTSQWVGDEMKAKIVFQSVEITQGVISIEAINKADMEVSFNSADFLSTTSKWLYEQDLGRISFGKATLVEGGGDRPNTKHWNVDAPFVAYKQYWADRLLEEFPQIVAPTMAVKDATWQFGEDIPGRPPGATSCLNQRVSRVNNYSVAGYGAARQSYAKILPTVQLAYILSKIYPNFGDIFNSRELRRIMLVTTYHPAYQTATNDQVWSLDKTTGEVYIDLADFMPKVNTGDFVCECLKLVCASLFIVKGAPVVAMKEDVLLSDNVLDWSHKVIGTPSIKFSKGRKYVVEYSDQSSDEPLPVERVVQDVFDVGSMIHESAADTNLDTVTLRTFQILSTGQVFEQMINSMLSSDKYVHFDYKLIWDIPTLSPGEDQVSESYSVSLDITPVRMVVSNDMLSDQAMVPDFTANSHTSKHDYIYCPEVELPKENKRPENILIGSYFGKKRSLGFGTHFYYPFITSDNCDAFGDRTSVSISLELDGDRGLIKQYHAGFKRWTQRDKKVLSCRALLDVLDLRNLDLRSKVHVNGRNYLVKEVSVTIGPRSIEPTDVELIEL